MKSSMILVALIAGASVAIWHFRPSNLAASSTPLEPERAVATPAVGAAVVQVQEAIDPATPRQIVDAPVAKQVESEAQKATFAMGPLSELEPYTDEQVFNTLELAFKLDENRTQSILRGFARNSCLEDPAEVRRRFGAELSDVDCDAILGVSATYNTQIRDLAVVYAADVDLAMRDTFRSGSYSLEDPLPDGNFRAQLPGESRIAVPGRAAYYTISGARYPHLESHRKERYRLARERDTAVWQYLAEQR
jgi:hypothetical protein